MTNFDEKIKSYAANEQVQTPEGFDERIDSLLENILEKGVRRSFRGKMFRPSFIAAVIGSIIILIGGAVYASGVISSYDVGWDGKIVKTNYEEEYKIYPLAEGYVQESADEKAFRQVRNDGEVIRVLDATKDGKFRISTSQTGIIETCSSINELKELLRNSKLKRLKLPSYIPVGYTLDSISILFYLSPDYVDENMPPTQSVISENGNLMQTFKFPDIYKKYIGSYQLTLRNGDKGCIDIIGRFEENFDVVTFGVSPNGKVSNPKIQGFNKTIFYSDLYEDNGSTTNSSIMAVLQKMDAVRFLTASELDMKNPSIERYKSRDYTFKNIRYDVIATNDDSINEEEAVKIIESLSDVE